MSDIHAKPNHLIRSTSPYLLQHAYNPVDWYPWGPEALGRAAKEDKPIIVSIGYSSCHWCHVMERESFESTEIAGIMNARFICIKVDREERPDIDQVYMDAVQVMGIHGGWPLNVFLTPGQKPFYGGTYFRPAAWKQLLVNISETWLSKKTEVLDSAEKFTEYLGESDFKKFNMQAGDESRFDELETAVQKLAAAFDPVHGGFNRSPKFPMPALWKFMMRSFHQLKDEKNLAHVFLTLKKMASGGIYDQVGGGFARYSTDERWFAPHFEKMLYDNAQLLSLYSESYRLNPDPLFEEVVRQTFGFITREMLDPSGGFYSALDADSEGEEGKYYTWTATELDLILKDNAGLLKNYWSVSRDGNWENGRNILAVIADPQTFSAQQGIQRSEFNNILSGAREILLAERNKRIRPGLDNKILVAWNGLMIKGLTDAFLTFGDEKFLNCAVNNAELISGHTHPDGELPRAINKGDEFISGFLDDYACVIEAFIALYEASFDEKWIHRAALLAEYTIANFYDEGEGFFYYTNSASENLIARKKEIFDNVIPGSNSIMALNLYLLGTMLDKNDYVERAEKMMKSIGKLMISEPEYLFNWGLLYHFLSAPFAEIAVVGPGFLEAGRSLAKDFRPGKIVMATEYKSDLPLFEGRVPATGNTTLYVCYNKSCKLPVHTVAEALNLLE